jgi:hypothetical protein
MLIHSPLLQYAEGMSIAEQYNWLLRVYSQDRFMLDDTSVFGVELRCMSKDVRKFVHWVNLKIVLKLGRYEYESSETYNVLLRIATGMLNKLDLPDNIKLIMHDNMTRNIHKELDSIVMETLPF